MDSSVKPVREFGARAYKDGVSSDIENIDWGRGRIKVGEEGVGQDHAECDIPPKTGSSIIGIGSFSIILPGDFSLSAVPDALQVAISSSLMGVAPLRPNGCRPSSRRRNK